jgi:DNA-binding CsgD family transcriptional regulator
VGPSEGPTPPRRGYGGEAASAPRAPRRPAGRADGGPGELERGREAYARRAWGDAYALLTAADGRAPLGTEDLQRLAWAAALTGRDAEFLRLEERVHHAHLEAGEGVPAARAAFWLGHRLLVSGEPGRAAGWLARSQRLVEQAERSCVEEGYLLLPSVFKSFAAGDWKAAHEAAASAGRIADRFGEADLSAFARCLQGRALMRQGRIEDGMALLDEAMVAATTGELSPLFTGLLYCSVISSCRQVYAFDRSREWTEVLTRWCEEQPQLVPFTGTCLVHRAEVMEFAGAWLEAIAEARRVLERLSRGVERGERGDALYQQGEIHRLRGELAPAEEAYRAASQLGREPQPGLALLRAAQGNAQGAASAIRRALDATTDPLQRTRLLPAQVEIMLAAGDLDQARAGAQELEAIAARFDTGILGAMAAHARGAVLLADGDAKAALAPLRHAFSVWHGVGAPYVAARVRVLIGRCCRAVGDHEGAALELDAARAVFAELGAAPELARLEAMTSGPRPGRVHGLTARELEVLRLVAAGKTNKAIAKQLFLSEKTVDRHVSNIFTKVNVPTRAAATAYAYQHKLV